MRIKMRIVALVAGVALALAGAVPVEAAGFFTNGVPVAGGTQYPSTLPLTGNETIPADTNLASGQNPQSEAITVAQLIAAANVQGEPNVVFNTATNVAAFTATTAQVAGADNTQVLALTGTLTAGAALTTPTAAAIITALGNYGVVGQTYALRFINSSSGAFAWTITGGTGVTVTGTATVAQNTFREYAVTIASATTVTLQNIGAGTN